jgi:membrane protease YdiL (CAAX protease family)
MIEGRPPGEEPRVLRPGIEARRGETAAAVGFAMVFPSLATWLYFVLLAGNAAMPAVAGACKVLQFGGLAAWAALRDGWWPPRVPLGRRGLGLGLLLGVALGGAMVALFEGVIANGELAQIVRPLLVAKLTDLGATTPAAFLGLAAFYSVLHSLLEELYWRWLVFGRLTRFCPPRTAGLVASLAFMSHHVIVVAMFLPAAWRWSVAPPLALGVAVAGGSWCWLYRRTGSLAGPWLCHACLDAAIMLVGYRLAFAA